MVDTASEAEWKAWRAEGLGASDIAAAATGSYDNSPLTVVARKLGKLPEPEYTTDMERGHVMEPAIIRAVEALVGLHAVELGIGMESRDVPWMRCTPDALLAETPDAPPEDAVIGLEVKTAQGKLNMPYYIAQIQWTLAVTGFPRWLLAVWHTERENLMLDVVHADPQMQAELLDLGRKMWAHIEAGTLPDADWHPGTTAALSALYPEHEEGETLVLDDDEAFVVALLEARRTAEEADKRKAELENELRARMGTAEVATLDGRVVATWRSQTSSRLDTKALRSAHPAIAAEFSRDTHSRRLLVK